MADLIPAPPHEIVPRPAFSQSEERNCCIDCAGSVVPVVLECIHQHFFAAYKT